MHKASAVLAAGADFRLLGLKATMLASARPVVAVSACAPAPASARPAGGSVSCCWTPARVALVRHPMPYGDLEQMRVQRFATLADIDASNPTIEEREEYEEPVRQGMIMYAGVDYRAILTEPSTRRRWRSSGTAATTTSRSSPPTCTSVADPLRPGHELGYHPGETNLRMADVVVINKVDSAEPAAVAAVAANVAAVNPRATVIRAASPVVAGAGTVAGRRPGPGAWRTARALTQAACPMGPARSPPAKPGRSASSTPGLLRSARSPTFRGGRASGWVAGHGLRRAHFQELQHHRRRRLRGGRGRHPDRPAPAGRTYPPGPPCPLRAARAGPPHLADVLA